jgi:hypothetical protein
MAAIAKPASLLPAKASHYIDGAGGGNRTHTPLAIELSDAINDPDARRSFRVAPNINRPESK